jgi:hypothetical protein
MNLHSGAVIAAAVCFFIAALFDPPQPAGWNRLVALGLFCFALSLLV